MCFSVSPENRIYLIHLKGRFLKQVDKINDSLVNLIEDFDKKYKEFGETILKKYQNMKSDSKRYYKYSPTSTMSPTSSASRMSPFEDIDTYNISIKIEDESNIQIKQTNSNTHIHTNSTNQSKSNSNSNSNIQSNSNTHSKEMIEKHFIDKTESFLDDAWDIINSD